MNRINAPQMAYTAVYNKEPPFLPGRIFTETKIWNNISVDAHLKDEWLNSLNSIEGIEIRSSCEGHNKDRPTFIIFRPYNQNENYISNVVTKLNKFPNTFAIYNIGNGGFFRICVASNTWYSNNNKKWLIWWNNISKYIKSSL